jgi:pimeloyl-ACP methyl ester carboxylesterase
MRVEERNLSLPSGRISARCWEPEAPDRSWVVCVPGLSANARSFDRIAAGLASAGHGVAAIDLRGRGRSEVTPEGTYGWRAHAADLASVAAALGAPRIDVVGHSMGAYVAMQLASDHPGLVGRLVLIDGAGAPEPAALGPIAAGLRRLDRWHPSRDAYLDAIRAGGVVSPWDPTWEDFYDYELELGADGRVRARTSLLAALEDLEYGRVHRHDDLWGDLEGPALLIRATRPLGDSGGFVVSAADAARFRATVREAEVVPVDANHFGVMIDAETVAAVTAFLGEGGRGHVA